jgi:hypothetical protein
MVAPDQLLANPLNWRIHPKAQQGALEKMLDRVGWVNEVIVNRASGFVVDGHLRVSLALRRGEASIPVKYVDLTEEEEHLVLATLDPLSALAVPDDAVLATLVQLVTDDGLTEILDAVNQPAQPGQPPNPGGPEEPSLPGRVVCPNCGTEFTYAP